MAHSSPVDDLVEQIRSRLHAARRETVERVTAIITLAEAYQEAVELELAARYAEVHSLPQPQRNVRSASAAAQALRTAVEQLPELQPPPPPTDSGTPTPPVARPPTLPAEPALGNPAYEQLEAAARQAPVVIVGGVPKPEKLSAIGATLRQKIEWIDTTRQGTHAIGNLERRIREHRVAALVILEGLISHRHSDPLLSAARSVSVPHAYGGKGGTRSIQKAFEAIDRQLGSAPADRR